MRASSLRAPLLKSFIWRRMYSMGRPAMSADSGCPCPDIRWQEPQAARTTPASPFTIPGAAPCSSGNQSGGFALLAALAASYSLLLPGTWTGPVASTLGGCTLSGMLYAQGGRPLGIVCDTSAADARANSEAT